MYSNTQSEYDDKKIGEMKICINIKKSHQMRNFRLNIKKLFMLALFAVHIQNKFLSLGCEKKINCRNKYEAPKRNFLNAKLNLENILGTKNNFLNDLMNDIM